MYLFGVDFNGKILDFGGHLEPNDRSDYETAMRELKEGTYDLINESTLNLDTTIRFKYGKLTQYLIERNPYFDIDEFISTFDMYVSTDPNPEIARPMLLTSQQIGSSLDSSLWYIKTLAIVENFINYF